MKKIIIILLCLNTGKTLQAEEYPDWEGYPPMNSMTDVIEFKGNVYGTSESGIFSYNPLTREYKLFYKNHSLAENNVLSIASTTNEIFIGFKNDGLMRFDPENEIFEPILFPEYIDREDILKTIAVNDIFALSDSILYIGHSKGVDRLNLNTEELHTYTKLSLDIKEDTPVNEVKVFNSKIWACTPEGLAWADVDNQNLESEEEWDSYKFARGVNCILNFIDDNGDTTIFVGTNGRGIIAFDWVKRDTLYTEVTSSSVFSMSVGQGTCFAAAGDGLFKKSTDIWFRDSSVTPLRAVIAGSGDKMWVASAYGLKCFISSGYWGIPEMNVPMSLTFRKIDITEDNVIWAATSWRDNGGYVLRYHDDEWVSYNEEDGLPCFHTNAIFSDNRGNIWGSTWSKGVYILNDGDSPKKDDDIITLVDPEKEIIIPHDDFDPDSYRVCPDITADKYGNIWIAGWNKGAYVLEGNLPINEYKYNRFLFDEGGIFHYVRKVFPDNEGWVWLGTWNTGLICLYVGEDSYDTSDDEKKYISYEDNGSGLLGNRIEAITIDMDGYIWVGTDGGLNRITKLQGNILKVENMNGLLERETVEVLSIDIDRFNNKWIGTSTGLIKLNSLNEIEQFYDRDNSGLFSNNILSLKYDNNSDILWVGTDRGLNRLNVFRAGSDKGEQFHVYPNPFEIWGDDSKAVFTDMKPSKPVRIYTFTGELVNELISGESGGTMGSTAVWNGRNFKSDFVGSGIYFFTGIDKNGLEFREKIVVIRR
ncbi:two-component regulator propeller domain-containing protein [Candidatus Latescibacterota bacterium]